jgi:hypothetical protein
VLWLLYCVWAIFVLVFLQVSPWEKSGTVRSSDHTGYGITIYMKTLSVTHQHTTVDWYFVTEEVLKWHDSIRFKNPHWMKSRTMRSSNHTAMGYPVFKNALCHSLTSYLLNWSIVMEQNRFRNAMTSFFSMCRLLPTTPHPPPRAKVHYELCHSALHHPILYDVLYNKLSRSPFTFYSISSSLVWKNFSFLCSMYILLCIKMYANFLFLLFGCWLIFFCVLFFIYL